ncbi:MAG: hypothetical protein ABI039_00870, partial [Vicinamibacterales bacterium]
MSDPVRSAALLPGEVPSRWRGWRSWLLRTFPGRALILGVVIKAFTWPLRFAITLPTAIDAIDMVGSLALLFAVAYGLTRFTVWAKRRLLWRVRRKLILSYVFVGVVPALLVIVFFLLAGLIVAFNVSSYLVQSRVRNLTDQARFLAQTVQLEVQRVASRDALVETLERRQSSTESRYPFSSIAVVPVANLTCKVEPAQAARVRGVLPSPIPVTAGPWQHLPAPTSLPKWIGCDGFSGLVAYTAPAKISPDGEPPQTRLVLRAVAFPEVTNPTWAVILDMPLSTTMEQRIQQETGIRLGEISAVRPGGVQPVAGHPIEDRPGDQDDSPPLSLTQARWVV